MLAYNHLITIIEATRKEVLEGEITFKDLSNMEDNQTGNNNKECNFKYLMANKPVFKGDKVVTSGTDQFYPPYIPIGRVVRTQKNYLTLNVKVKPFFLEKPIKQLVVLDKISNE